MSILQPQKFSDAFSLDFVSYGNGTKILLCFPGFGELKENYLNKILPYTSIYTVYVFDLFENKRFKTYESMITDHPSVKCFFNKFFEEYNINNFSVWSFSIGARYAWSLLFSFQNRIEALYFLAPDGIKVDNWYWLSTSTTLARAVFQNLLNKQISLVKIIKFFKLIRIVSKTRADLATAILTNKKKKDLLFRTWITLCKLQVTNTLKIKLINNNSIPTFFFIVKKDKLIPEGHILKFSKKINFCEVHLVEGSHFNLPLNATKIIHTIIKKNHEG